MPRDCCWAKREATISLRNHATPLHCHCTTGYAALTYVAAYAVSATLSTLFNVSKYLTNEMPLGATSLSLSFSLSPPLCLSTYSNDNAITRNCCLLWHWQSTATRRCQSKSHLIRVKYQERNGGATCEGGLNCSIFY